MNKLLTTIRKIIEGEYLLPFSIYTASKEQHLLNVPIIKPLLVVVLNGEKELEESEKIICPSGSFIFLSDSPAMNMRSIPNEKDYLALMIQFDSKDFDTLDLEIFHKNEVKKNYCVGQMTIELENCLNQFIEMSAWAPSEIFSSRRKEILQLLCLMGHREILSLATNNKITNKVHALISNKIEVELTMKNICVQLAMSESTLQRRLKKEGTTIQGIRDQVKLGLGLYLLQTTLEPIGIIADKCGYLSQSRFTERFKERFGLTPSALRKTK